MTLEQMLQAMERYGEPRVSRTGNGWVSSCDMHVNATGAKFEIRSEFGHATPGAAAAECLTRMRDILGGFGADVARLEVKP
ncbi:hypothetical protein [Dyella sp.]|uniref:hypothetical protein n=1 Tax=Dyella sp. TaxID=1869338 RepID=UPI0028415FCC|nr:hypothetical protein [Dyella sp.]MDR3444725.1 hypothetical protein [Dyella sp.]